MSRRSTAIALGLLAWFAQVASAAPTPYDSIANPLGALPATDGTIQRKGDSLNMSPNRLRVNQAGYRQRDVSAGYAKFYCVGCPVASFSVVNAAGVTMGSGILAPKGATVSGQITAYASNSAEHAHNGEGDWKKGYPMTGKTVSGALTQGVLPAALPPGQYTIRVGADTSVPFIVSDNVYGMARDAALKFFGVARSGDYESWFHGPSHTWDGWLYDSAARNPDGTYKYKGALQGGWYDCGNHLKEARTNSYPLAALGMLAATMPEKDADRYGLNHNNTANTDRIPDVLREAWVGAQFVVNSWRLAKGKPADMILSVGELGPDFNWWGRPENHDAVLSPSRGGRKERKLFKNWGTASMADFAAGMAFLSRLYRPYDPAFADSARVIAKAMYEGAKTANRDDAMPDYTADNTAFDDLGLAAVALLWATGEKVYLNEAIYTKGLPTGKGGVCPSTVRSAANANTLFDGGFFACDKDDGMKKKGGPTDYSTAQSLALYSFVKLILANPDTAARYGITPAQRDTFLLRSITQMAGPLWGSSAGPAILIPTGDLYNPTRLTYDSIWYSMGIGYGKPGWWNKYQFGNLADLYMFYDMTSLVEGRTILDKPGSTDWKRKEILQVLLGGLNYMFGTNALDLSYLYGIGRKNPMHPHHRGANPEGKNVPGAYYNYTIPVGGLYGGLTTGPTNNEVLVEKFGGPVAQTEANCPDAQAAVLIPLMGLASESPVAPPKATVTVKYTTDTSAVIQVELDKWGWIRLGYGLDSLLPSQTKFVNGGDTAGSFTVHVGGLKPATQYFFHVLATDLQGLSTTTSKRANGAADSVAFSFTTKAQPPSPPRFSNIKVCNITSDSAEVMWVTPNGEYLSSVKFADSASWKAGGFSTVDADAAGDVQVKFHRVKLKGLKPKTTYYFQVGVPGSHDPAVGCFRTPGEDVKFDIRTTHYTWDGKPAMGIAVVNQDVKSYDSLQIRLYVNGTRANILDLAARVDIAFAYRADGFADSGLFAHTKNVQRSRPQLIDPTCPAATQSCAWYFDLPLHGAVMETQARWRLDVVFDRHNLIRDSTEILNMAPTHDPFAVGTQDWSMRAHVAGTDNGLSPVDYAGVPLASKNAVDSMAMDIPVNPYIAVYRRNEFVYGFSPYAAEQATKRVVYAMEASFQKPFDVQNGSTIELGAGSSTRLKGDLNPYDLLMPSIKGHVNAVWVNGVALTDAERKAALVRKADGTWSFDIPLKLVTGTNKVDVTFFAGSDSTETVATGGCTESRGCAFYNAGWYVNYVSSFTPSILSVVDAADAPVSKVVPDTSQVRIRLVDGNANHSKTQAEGVTIALLDRKTGRTQMVLSLSETGPNTGVFVSELRRVVSTAPVGAQIRVLPGDTLDIRYVDADDPTDSAFAWIWASSSWPSLVSGAVVAGCGTNRVSAKLDKPLGVGYAVSGQQLLRNAGFEDKVPTTEGELYNHSGLLAGWTVQDVDVVNGNLATGLGSSQGILSLDLNSVRAGWIGQRVVTVPGSPVRISLSYSANLNPPSDSPDLKMAAVVWNGIAVDTLVWNKATEPIRSWKKASWDLVGTGSDSILIRSLIGGNAGIMVDDISIQALVPSATSVSDSILGGTLVLTDARGDTVQRTALVPSDIAVAPSGTDLVVQPAIPVVAGVTGGSLEIRIRTAAGKIATSSAVLTDSVGPWIDSARIVENVDLRPVDTLLVWTSEPTRFAPRTLPVLLSRSGAPLSAAGVVVDSSWLSDPANGRWTFLLRGGVVKAGDLVRWSAQATDSKGVPSLDCPTLAREIKLVSRPAPFSRAWIVDADGDGRADQARLVFRKAITAKDKPDSVEVRFGIGSERRTVAVLLANAADSNLVLALPPFAFGSTTGAGPDGSGSVFLWKSGVANGPYPLSDSVGPALVAASLRYGAALDTVELAFSEPVRTGAGVGWITGWPGLELGTLVLPDSVAPSLWRLPVVPGSVVPGDSLRLGPTSIWGDARGRKAGALHPWIPVAGAERSPLGGWYKDADGDGRVDLAVVVFPIAPRTRPAFSLWWPNAAGGLDSSAVDSGAWAPGPDGRTVTVPVGPFAYGITSTLDTMLGRWPAGGNVRFSMRDSVPPVLVSAVFRYGSADGLPDTLRVRWSEPATADVSGNFLRHGSATAPSPVAVLPAGVRLDRLEGWVTLRSDSVQLRKGDSVSFSAWSAFDRGLNYVGPVSPFVPVDFGPRPARIDFRLRPYMELPSATPRDDDAFQIWVRARGEEVWLHLDSSVVKDTSFSWVGATLTMNKVLTGGAYVFDNGGTFVASADLDTLGSMAKAGKLPKDGSETFQVRFAWDGRSRSGKQVASGPYVMRLLLKDIDPDNPRGLPVFTNRVYKLGIKRPTR